MIGAAMGGVAAHDRKALFIDRRYAAMIEHKGTPAELPNAVASMICVEITAPDGEFLAVRRVCAVKSCHEMLALCCVPINRKKAVGDAVDRRFPLLHHLRQPADEVVRPTAEHGPMIVNGIIMIERPDERKVASINAPTIAHNKIGKRDPVEERAIRHPCAAFRPAWRPKNVQSARLMPEL